VVRETFVKAYGSDGVRGLLYGDFSQFFMQVIDAAAVVVFGFVMAYVWFKVSDLITPLRVSKETEIEGLDGPEMGVLGYPDFQLHPSTAGAAAVEASTAAAGWDGGEYGGYRSSDGVLVATLTAWDSNSQAREAADAFGRWLSIRYTGGSPFDAGSGRGWQSSAGAGEVVQNGSRLLLLLGPSARDVGKARAAFAGF